MAKRAIVRAVSASALSSFLLASVFAASTALVGCGDGAGDGTGGAGGGTPGTAGKGGDGGSSKGGASGTGGSSGGGAGGKAEGGGGGTASGGAGAGGGSPAGGMGGRAAGGGPGGAGGTAGGAGGTVGGAGGNATGGAPGGVGGKATGGAGGTAGGAGGTASGAGGTASGAGGTAGGAGGNPAGGAPGGAGGKATGGAGVTGGTAGTAGGGAGGATIRSTANLIVNGDAEATSGSPDGFPVATPGWSVFGEATAMEYGAPNGYPVATDPGPAVRGNNFFSGGRNDDSSTLTQTIDLAAYTTAIASGAVTYALDGHLGGYLNQEDSVTVRVYFMNEVGTPAGTATIGPVTSTERSSLTGLLRRTATGAVPAATVSATVRVTMTRAAGASNDGYADNLSLVLSGPLGPAGSGVDGQLCNAGAECASGTCNKIFYLDADGDGFGTGTVVGFCTLASAPGFATQGGDCCDNDGGNQATAKLIHPGAAAQTTSAGGVCGGISWDYDCNGTEQVEAGCTAIGTCSSPVCQTVPCNPDTSCGKMTGVGFCTPNAGVCSYGGAPGPNRPWACK